MVRLRSVAALFLSAIALQWSGCSSTVSPPANAPKLSVPATIEFGKVRVGLIKDTSVRFTNNGTDVLTITSQGFSASQFMLADTSQRTLKIDAGGYQDVRLRFMPADSSSINANDTIHSNVGATVMALHGGGIALTRTLSIPATIEFGNVRVGLCDDSMLGMPRDTFVVIHNNGNDTLRISSATAQPSTFSVVSFAPRIAPGDSGMIRMRFCPAQLGVSAGTLTFASNATPDTVTTIALSGMGVPYTPGTGSTFVYAATALDSAANSTHPDPPVTLSVTASGVTYGGKDNVSISSDGVTSTYFRIENNSDVNFYVKGFPTSDTATLIGSGWLLYPFGSQMAMQELHTDSTSFTDSKGAKVSVRVRDSAGFFKTTTITVGGRQLQCSVVNVHRLAIYYNVIPALAVSHQEQVYFSPAIGFLVREVAVNDQKNILANKISGGGILIDLQSYKLK